MNILGIQLVGVIFGIIFIYLTFLNKKRDELNTSEAGFWIVVWGGLIFISIFPGALNFVVKDILDISRILDFFIIMAFLVMFGVIFYIFILTKRTSNKMEKLVRAIALKKNSKNKR